MATISINSEKGIRHSSSSFPENTWRRSFISNSLLAWPPANAYICSSLNEYKNVLCPTTSVSCPLAANGSRWTSHKLDLKLCVWDKWMCNLIKEAIYWRSLIPLNNTLTLFVSKKGQGSFVLSNWYQNGSMTIPPSSVVISVRQLSAAPVNGHSGRDMLFQWCVGCHLL